MRKLFNPKSVFSLLCFFWLAQAAAFGQYCLPGYDNQCTSDDYIDRVTFAGINNVGTGCGSPGANNYIDYSTTMTANVTISQTYTITCAPGPTWGQYFVCMFDFNHDNDFADAGEFFDIGYSFGGGTVSNTIKIPCGALTGATRFRVMCQYSNTQLFQSDICAPNLTFGEVEDYNAVISPPVGTDAHLKRIVSPVSACGLTSNEVVRVRIANVGGTPINGYTVCYKIGANTPVCETVSTVIPSCDSVLHTFATPANLSVPGQYNFKAYVTVTGDANHANDTVSNHIVDNVPIVNTLPYVQNFDVTNGGWTANGINSSWAWGVPAATFIPQSASPTKAWVTNLTGPHNDDETSFLLSPCFNLSGFTSDPYLTFSHIFETEQEVDFDYVEMSTNAGSTWNKVGTYGTGNNWYNNLFDYWTGTSGNPGDWQSADHQLTGSAGFSSVRFRFAFSSDAFNSFEGIGIDDVRLVDTLKNTGTIALTAPANGCLLTANEAVSITIQNFGSHSISNIPVCYRFNGGAANCEVAAGPIAPGGTYTHTFATTVNMSTPNSYSFVVYTNWGADYNRTNDTLITSAQSFPLVNTFPYKETFEAGQGGWVSGGTAFNDWGFGTPAKATIVGAASGVNAWVTAGTGANEYVDNTNNWVESPCFDLTTLTNPWVTVKVWWSSEFTWDGTVLEYTTNSGSTWNEIGVFGDPFNWYNYNDIEGLNVNGGTGNGWSGEGADGSGGYVLAKHSIAGLAGQSSVRFRIHFATDISVQADGFAFDDFVVADPPVVDLGPDTMVCASAVLSTNHSSGTFLWSNGATTPTITVTTPGTYFVEYTDTLSLSDRDTIVLNFSPTPAVDLGPDAIVCHGDTNCFTLNPSLYSNIHWSTGATTNSICVSTAGSWSVSADDALGCTSSDTIATTVVALPTPSLGADTTLCAGDTLCFTSNCGPNHTYIWNTGSTAASICVNAIGGYWVHCIDINGCEGGDSIIVTQAVSPLAVGAADTSNCPIVQFTSTSTANSVTWDFGDGGTSTQGNPSHDYTSAGNGSYTVTLTAINDCGTDITTIVVDINCIVSVNIGNAMDNQLKLFPNPSRGKFKLETLLSGEAPVAVTITDVHGKTVYHHNFGQHAGKFSELINLEEESKGVYFVKFEVGGQQTIRKVVLQ